VIITLLGIPIEMPAGHQPSLRRAHNISFSSFDCARFDSPNSFNSLNGCRGSRLTNLVLGRNRALHDIALVGARLGVVIVGVS